MYPPHRYCAFVFRSAPDLECSTTFYITQITSSLCIFLICPEGWSYWTPRLYTAIECRCIPIIISDEFEIPFKNGFDFSKGIIRLSHNDDLSKLEEIVSKINIKETQEFWELHRSKLLWDSNKPIFEQDSGKLLLKELEHVKENINIV